MALRRRKVCEHFQAGRCVVRGLNLMVRYLLLAHYLQYHNIDDKVLQELGWTQTHHEEGGTEPSEKLRNGRNR